MCDRFDPDFICNASDKRRRYSYQAQPSVCRWNLARLAQALGSELNAAEAGAILDEFMPTYETFYLCIMRKKLGLVRKEEVEDGELISDLLRVMQNTGKGKKSCWKYNQLFFFSALSCDMPFQVQISQILSTCSIVSPGLRRGTMRGPLWGQWWTSS